MLWSATPLKAQGAKARPKARYLVVQDEGQTIEQPTDRDVEEDIFQIKGTILEWFHYAPCY